MGWLETIRLIGEAVFVYAVFFGSVVIIGGHIYQTLKSRKIALPVNKELLAQLASEHWEVDLPIKLRWSDIYTLSTEAERKEKRFSLGAYTRYRRKHVIILVVGQTREVLLRTIAHELQHAAQSERAGSAAKWEYRRALEKPYSYRDRPMEIEAREHSRLKWKYLEGILDPKLPLETWLEVNPTTL